MLRLFLHGGRPRSARREQPRATNCEVHVHRASAGVDRSIARSVIDDVANHQPRIPPAHRARCLRVSLGDIPRPALQVLGARIIGALGPGYPRIKEMTKWAPLFPLNNVSAYSA